MGRHLTAKQCKLLISMYLEGWSLGAVSKAAGCSLRTAGLHIDKAGIPRHSPDARRDLPRGRYRPFRRSTPEEDAFISNCYRRGLSSRSIGAELNRTHDFVLRRLQASGVPRRKSTDRGIGKCIECGKPSGIRLRCPYHVTRKKADTNRKYIRLKRGIPKERWKLAF